MKMGFCSILSLILVIFKLLGKLDISWFWALSPVWIGLGISFSIMAAFGLLALIVGVKKK